MAGPWTEARFRTSTPRVVKARHWVTYVESLRETATLDVEAVRIDIADHQALLNARTEAARRSLASAQIARAKGSLAKSVKKRLQVRRALLLEDDPDG